MENVAYSIITTIMLTFLAVPFLNRILKLLLVMFRVPWRNQAGERMPGELPKLPFGHFNEVNFFGRDLSRKHGAIYFIWHCLTPVVIISDAKAIRTFYTDHYSHERESDMTCLGAVFKGILGRCLATSHGRDDVRRCRGPFEKYFSASATANHMRLIGKECQAFMNTLPVGVPIDLKASRLEDITLRVVTHVVYGKEVLEKYFEKIVELQHHLLKTLSLINVGTTRLPFYSKLPNSTNYRAACFNQEWTKFNRFLFGLFEEGKISGEDGLFFETMALLKTRALDIEEEELLHSIDEILLLNIDVSFAATSFALSDLARYQDIQTKLRAQIDDVLQGCESSSCEDLDKKLPYLEMVLKESARLHPALALSLPEKTVKSVTDLGGYQISQGTPVCVDTYSLNYSPTYWNDPEEFNPERFSTGRQRVPGSFFQFGMGPRKCLGYRFALAITRVVVVSFLQNFQLRLSENTSYEKVKKSGLVFFAPYISPDIVLERRETVDVDYLSKDGLK
ncbi:cytochrome P450 monooxygenase tcpC-like isoform X2 [Dendronephthya gigantea]|uniref:cytochrome P450 monooxygenase tcpC-like isoform X2 n=1 Tax=Dendronephthya gigantea TaxID=151771 RepID=UPI00106C5951|nr:cytochrome P450 monooxygenase tcpC-like isoform X2 [Dendronephthya gigantea]XP_028412139.1 cytochrome P450 monooxygenase tcpC-like isoform X2 [Dendronephthya gigantea]